MSSSTSPPCSENEVTPSSGDCASSGVEEFIENVTIAGLRVWQLTGIVLSVFLAIMIALCCCKRFRIPRTKQEIEADYIRKKITRSFMKELMKIKNEEMDEMDLRRALERVRATFDAETELQKHQEASAPVEPPPRFRTRINAILHGVHLQIMAKNEPKELSDVI